MSLERVETFEQYLERSEPYNAAVRAAGDLPWNRGLVEARDRYRVERDTARGALAAAEARIVQLQRAEVERLASDSLSHAEDLLTLSGNDVSYYLTESGEVDADKVAADVAAILAERPGLRKQAPAFDPSQGHGGRTPKAAPAEPSFADLFKSTNQPY